ncbi:MAG: Uma2 family endonuclease [Coleofasciculaceae cyanobacterium RL_1_1]|nr:Uma2 family endonuclease [Coleofasciculaceae cyanobacterium RL_1_1]
MTQAQIASLTLEQFLAQPETKPASEYHAGEIHQKPMPQGKHSYLQSELTACINAALRKSRIARAGAELRCTFGNRSIVPDIAVFTWDKIPRDADGNVANQNSNHLVIAHQLSRQLVKEIFPSVRNFGMQFGDLEPCLIPIIRAFQFPGQCLLRVAKAFCTSP